MQRDLKVVRKIARPNSDVMRRNRDVVRTNSNVMRKNSDVRGKNSDVILRRAEGAPRDRTVVSITTAVERIVYTACTLNDPTYLIHTARSRTVIGLIHTHARARSSSRLRSRSFRVIAAALSNSVRTSDNSDVILRRAEGAPRDRTVVRITTAVEKIVHAACF
jgi:hypothetical protein